MQPGSAGGIEHGVAVVYHVQGPQPGYPVEKVMGEVLGHQVQRQEGHHQLDQGRQSDHAEKAETIPGYEVEDDQCESTENQIDGHYPGEQGQVGARVPPLGIGGAYQGDTCLKDPCKRQAGGYPYQSLPRGHCFEEGDECIHPLNIKHRR